MKNSETGAAAVDHGFSPILTVKAVSSVVTPRVDSQGGGELMACDGEPGMEYKLVAILSSNVNRSRR